MTSEPWLVAPTGDPELDRLIALHPGFSLAASGHGFWRGDWHREVRIGDLSTDWAGLVELCDNNPMVCAGSFSVPGPFSTLALIALGPYIRAGILKGTPKLEFSGTGENPEDWLAAWGWNGPVSWRATPAEGEVFTLEAELECLEGPDAIRELLEESYARSVFVRQANAPVSPGSPVAHYAWRTEPGKIRMSVSAWRHGKLGAAQILHAMNVMCGYEESIPFA